MAVKGIIVNKNGFLSLKRQSENIHFPEMWEIPGGRLELGEDPIIGLKREIKEETNLDIDVVKPLNVRHFTRKDGQVITMIIFLCRSKLSDVKISKEHSDYRWVDISESDENLKKYFADGFFLEELTILRKDLSEIS
ncbi:MAG: NUDIX domain-containing protein [Candidatus Nanoarchaeia archaeon]|nr:NUDIX domain-containing protein [Candidatus Nanoarchaeia archaeon]